MANKSVDFSKIFLIMTVLIMVASLIFLHPAYRAFLGGVYCLIIIGDLFVLFYAKSETFKRLMLVLSIVGALLSVFFLVRDLM